MTALREAVRQAIYPHMVRGSDYEDVPYTELKRARYLFLDQRLEQAATDAEAAVFAAIREQLDDPAWHQFAMTERILHGTYGDGWEDALSAVKMTLRQLLTTAERTAAAGKGE